MNVKVCRGVLGGILGAVYAISILYGNFLIPIIATVFAIFVLKKCEESSKEIEIDERIVMISEKASRKSLEIFAISGAVLGVVLLAVGSKVVGYTLLYSISALMVIYIAFYEYYRRKYGG